MKIELEQGGVIEMRRIEKQIVVELTSLDRPYLMRTCPRCGQQPGTPCKTKTGRTDGAVHTARWGQTPAEVLTCVDAAALIHALKEFVVEIEAGLSASIR